MKKKIHKIWGLGLVVVLAASLLLSAAPVSAGTLSWGDEDLPDELEAGNVLDLAVFPGGGVIYAAHSSGDLFRSTNRGESWSSITVVDGKNIMTNPTFVAVAPDDENYLAVANATGGVFLSSDAGANWDTLGDKLTTNGVTVNDLAMSAEKGGKHTVAIAGTAAAAAVWHYEIGGVGADWTETSLDTGFAPEGGDVAGAVAFSPNFASDEVMVAVTANVGVAVYLHIYSFNQDNWNTGTFSAYPAEVVTHSAGDADVTGLDSASIAMAPDYLGSDDAMRIVFVGLTTDDTDEDEASGIFRMDDDDSTTLKDEQFIHSVDFDGTNLVAGHYDSTNVRRSSDPLASSPSVSSATSTKRAGGTGLTIAAFAGSEVVVGTSGDESEFAISRDDGKTFNGLSLIDTDLDVLSDVAVTPDGEKVYLVTADNATNLSVWRLASSWERILSVPTAASDYIVRLAPDDDDIVYLADAGGTQIYYSSDGGEGKWHTRVSRYAITDLAIEGDGDVAYVLTTLHVSKSTNSGFTWATKKSHKISGPGGNMIASLGEDKVLVAGDGMVSYSTDGNETWTKLSDGIGGYKIQATATGLADGDFVFAAVDNAGEDVYRWEIGEDDEWDSIGTTPDDYNHYGIALAEGVLYVLSTNTTSGVDSKLGRSLDPTADDPSWSTVDSVGETFDAAPSALKVSISEGITKLWAINTLRAPNFPELFSYKDTLALVGPTSKTPRDGADVSVNWVSGQAFHVTLTWETPSDKVMEYNLNVALDSDFDEKVLDETITKSSGTWDEGDIISAVCGLGAKYEVSFMPETTYYWKVRVSSTGPVKSAWSEVRSFDIGALPEQVEPVIVEQPPAPVISVPPAPAITITPPEIVLPPAPAPPPDIVIPSPPAAPAPITPAFIWAIVIIGAILVIALVVLIIRTRRPV